MIALREVRSARPAALRSAAAGLRSDRHVLVRASALALSARIASRAAWSGGAFGAASIEMARVLDRIARCLEGLELAATAILRAAAEVESALEVVRHADRTAESAGGWIDLDGQLVLPQRLVPADPGAAALQKRTDEAARAEVQACIARARRLADDADSRLLVALRASAAAARGVPVPVVSAATALAGAHAVPAPPATQIAPQDPLDAYRSSAWWLSLRPEQRRQVLREHPEWIGNRDGIPAAARHEANLVLLDRAEAEARQRRAGIPDWDASGRTLASQRVAALVEVRTLLGKRDGHLRRLLVLDLTTEPPSIAVSLGDTDAAPHVSTFVGGLSTHPARDLGLYDDHFATLRAAASDAGEDVAIVSWLAYPAPQFREIASPDRSVARDRIAAAYGPALASFSHGLAAARLTPVHQSALAHSYGSNLAGHALRLAHAFDDVVLFGSPGTPLRSRADAALKPGSLNVLANPADIVSGPLGSSLGLRAVEIPGGRRLATGPSLPKAGTAPNTCVAPGSSGHSDYFDPRKASGRNLLGIMIGRFDLITEQVPAIRPLTRDQLAPVLSDQTLPRRCSTATIPRR